MIMKNLIPVVIGLAFVMASCGGDKEAAISKSEGEAKIDSLIGARTGDLLTQSTEDLDRRIAIEVKPKADSIFAAWQAAGGK